MLNPHDKSALGTDGKTAALLGYLFWIVALILIFIEKENKFVRFHAFQSVFWGILVMVLAFVGYILFFVLFFGGMIVGAAIDIAIGFPIVTFIVMIIAMIAMFVAIAAVIGGTISMIVAAVKAYNGNTFKMPLIGKFAEKYAYN